MRKPRRRSACICQCHSQFLDTVAHISPQHPKRTFGISSTGVCSSFDIETDDTGGGGDVKRVVLGGTGTDAERYSPARKLRVYNGDTTRPSRCSQGFDLAYRGSPKLVIQAFAR